MEHLYINDGNVSGATENSFDGSWVPHDQEIPLPGLCPREMKIGIQKTN